MDRRTFLKVLGGAAAGVAAAPLVGGTTGPLYIPAQNLDMGIPKPAIIVPASADVLQDFLCRVEFDLRLPTKTVPMMLVHDNYIPDHGGRLKAGSIVWEDEATAQRWASRNVAVRCDGQQPKIIPGRDWGRVEPLPIRAGYIDPGWRGPLIPESTQVEVIRSVREESKALGLFTRRADTPPLKPGKLEEIRRRIFQGWTRPTRRQDE